MNTVFNPAPVDVVDLWKFDGERWRFMWRTTFEGALLKVKQNPEYCVFPVDTSLGCGFEGMSNEIRSLANIKTEYAKNYVEKDSRQEVGARR